jgi:Uncharacterised nucleotidyltransferase
MRLLALHSYSRNGPRSKVTRLLSFPLNVTPEANLLLACINVTAPVEEKSERIAALVQQPIDWKRFTHLVILHGLVSLVCPVLKSKVGPHGIPLDIFASLRFAELANASKAEQNATELAVLMDRFDTAGIAAIVFKGPALSVLAFGNAMTRSYSDLDILVHPPNVVAAAEILISAGYHAHTYNREVFESGLFHNKSEDFYSDHTGVDLHWTLQDSWFPFGPDEDALWSRTEAFVLKGREFRTLGAADHLLFLCVHASKHGWPNLASVVDIAALLKARPEVDLKALIDEARRLGFGRIVLVGLSLAHKLAGAALQEKALIIIQRDHAAIGAAEHISGRLIRQFERPAGVSRLMVVVSTLESGTDKLRLLMRYGFTPVGDDYAKLPLARPLYPLYYLIHPLRLFAKVTSMVARRVAAAIASRLAGGVDSEETRRM